MLSKKEQHSRQFAAKDRNKINDIMNSQYTGTNYLKNLT